MDEESFVGMLRFWIGKNLEADRGKYYRLHPEDVDEHLENMAEQLVAMYFERMERD